MSKFSTLSFSGVMGRKEYFVNLLLIIVGLYISMAVTKSASGMDAFTTLLASLMYFLCLYLGVVNAVKRIRDMGFKKSWAIALVFLFSCSGIGSLIYLAPTNLFNRKK